MGIQMFISALLHRLVGSFVVGSVLLCAGVMSYLMFVVCDSLPQLVALGAFSSIAAVLCARYGIIIDGAC